MTREELIHKWNSYKGIIIYPTDNVKELINATIKALEQEPQTGHWINLYSDNYKCSECGVWWQGKEITESNYCPHCGCRMESEG